MRQMRIDTLGALGLSFFFGSGCIVNVIIMLYICNHKCNRYADNDKQNTDSLPV